MSITNDLFVAIRVNTKLKKEIVRTSRNLGVTQSEFIRMCILPYLFKDLKNESEVKLPN